MIDHLVVFAVGLVSGYVLGVSAQWVKHVFEFFWTIHRDPDRY